MPQKSKIMRADSELIEAFHKEAHKGICKMQGALGTLTNAASINQSQALHTLFNYSHNLKSIAASVQYKRLAEMARVLCEIFRDANEVQHEIYVNQIPLLIQGVQACKILLERKEVPHYENLLNQLLLKVPRKHTMKKILICDDSLYTRLLMKKILSKDYDLIEVGSRAAALEQFKQQKPDLVLLDIVMPQGDLEGVWGLQEILKTDPAANVIMVTAVGHDKIIERCKKLGAKDYIIKPFDETVLIERIKKCLGTLAITNKKNKFEEINKLASERASKALSKLLDLPMNLVIPSVIIKPLKQLKPNFAPEDNVVAIFLPISGQTEGISQLVFTEQSTFNLCDLLLKKESGTTKSLDELDQASMKEVCNIIIGNYLTVLSNQLNAELIESIPNILIGKFKNSIDWVEKQLGGRKVEVLVIEVGFNFNPTMIKGYTYIFLYEDEMEGLLS